MSDTPVIESIGLAKTFSEGDLNTPVLSSVDLRVLQGERVAIVGASGSGKSTLLHLLGGLDTPTKGEVLVSGTAINTLSEPDRGHLRNRELGFVYQFHHLLPEFTALENVAMPLLIRRLPTSQALGAAASVLTKIKKKQRLQHKQEEK